MKLFNNTIYVIAVVLLLFGSSVSCISAQAESPSEQLNYLFRVALQNNAELQSLHSQVEAAQAKVPFAGSLVDPQLSLGLSSVPVDSFDMNQEAMTQKQISLSQKIPWFGKRDLARNVAAVSALQSMEQLRVKQLLLLRNISDTWYDLNFTEYNLALNARLRAMIMQIEKIAETRYTTGDGGQKDILEAQLQQSLLLNEDQVLLGEKKQLRNALFIFLGSEQQFAVFPEKIDDVASDIPPVTFTENELVAMALRANPELTILQLEEKKAILGVQQAKKEYSPDMDFRISYGQREASATADRSDLLSASVSFSLPFWQSSRQDSLLASKQKDLLNARYAVTFFERNLPRKINALMAEITAADQSFLLLRHELAMQAGTLADSAMSAYSVGQADFTAAITSRIAALKYLLEAQKSFTLAQKKRAELYAFIGGSEEQQTLLENNFHADSSMENLQ